MNKYRYLLGILTAAILSILASCYTFKDVNFDPNIKTFQVNLIQNNAPNSFSALSQLITEELKEKILSESNMDFTDKDGDVEFSGEIQSYTVTPVSPQAGETSAVNRLTIRVNIDFVNRIDEKKNWNSGFSRFADFPSDQDFSSKEMELIDEILIQLVDDIFRKAFVNW